MEPARPRTRLPALTDRLSIGAGLPPVSPFCLGIVQDAATVVAAYEAGINFFFLTADMHWPLYAESRRGLAHLFSHPGVRETVVVAVSSYVTQPEFCEAPFEEVVASVPGLDRIDVAVIGGAYRADFETRLPIYQEHRERHFLGTRAIAASFHDRPCARDAIARGEVDVGFIRYNPLHAGAREEILDGLAPTRTTRVFNFKSTHGALTPEWWTRLGLPTEGWRPKVTDYYRYALTPEGMDGALVSLQTPEQVSALAAAMAEGPISTEQAQVLHLAADRAKAWQG